MAINQPAIEAVPREGLATARARTRGMFSHIWKTPKLLIGLIFLFSMLGLGFIGPLIVDMDNSAPMSVSPDQGPAGSHPFGTDTAGRDLFVVVITGIPLTLRIGLISGTIGLGVGTILGFVAGYMGGKTDMIIRSAADIMLTVPGLLVLIVIAASVNGLLSVNMIALVVASLAWMYPTRTIRSQVLSLRERPYVEMAKLNGLGSGSIIFKELMPNLLPYLGASFVGAVGSGILAAIGLEALGLGSQSEPTLGMTIYWAIYYSALLKGMWWWWAAPVGVIVVLFTSLFLIAGGLDEVANPRLRRSGNK